MLQADILSFSQILLAMKQYIWPRWKILNICLALPSVFQCLLVWLQLFCFASSGSSTAAIVVTTFQNKSFTSMPLHSAIPTGRRLVRTFRVAESLISQIGFPDYNVSENLASTKQASKAKLMFWELLWHSMKSHHITAWLCQHGPGRQQLVWPAVQMGFLNWGGR